MDLNKFKTDTNLEVKGVDVPMGDGCVLKIARMNNTAYKKYFNELVEPYRMQIRTGTLSEEIAEELLIKVMARTILLGWTALFIDGKELQYSEENAVKVLTEFKDFKELITSLSQNMEIFRTKEIDASIKNSEATSDGN